MLSVRPQGLKPELVLMDVSMPRLNGLEVTLQLRGMLPDCEVLILSQVNVDWPRKPWIPRRTARKVA